MLAALLGYLWALRYSTPHDCLPRLFYGVAPWIGRPRYGHRNNPSDHYAGRSPGTALWQDSTGQTPGLPIVSSRYCILGMCFYPYLHYPIICVAVNFIFSALVRPFYRVYYVNHFG